MLLSKPSNDIKASIHPIVHTWKRKWSSVRTLDWHKEGTWLISTIKVYQPERAFGGQLLHCQLNSSRRSIPFQSRLPLRSPSLCTSLHSIQSFWSSHTIPFSFRKSDAGKGTKSKKEESVCFVRLEKTWHLKPCTSTGHFLLRMISCSWILSQGDFGFHSSNHRWLSLFLYSALLLVWPCLSTVDCVLWYL